MFEIVYRYDSNQTKQRPVDADEARTCLVDGNQQFASLVKGCADSVEMHQEVIPLTPDLEPWSAPRLAGPPSSFDEFEALASRIASIRPT